MSDQIQDQQTKNDRKLPPDGTRVSATVYGSLEYDQEPWETEGKLQTEDSPLGLQCYVGGQAVDPATIRPVESADADSAAQDAPGSDPAGKGDVPPIPDPR